jgi:hypothetical protein
MNLTFAPKGILQIDNARIIYKNFSGKPVPYNREGERDFTLVIDDQDICDALLADVNKDGVPWNVKIKAPREVDEAPFITLKVKVKFSDYGPRAYLQAGEKTVELDEETIGCLDNIDMANVDLDIRPYDNVTNGKPYRTAYLQAIHVTQNVDRFAERFAGEEWPEE